MMKRNEKSHCTIAARAFSRTTLRALAARGVYIVRSVALPGASGSYVAADACTGYQLSTGQIRTWSEVKALAEAAA
jgi:hypothetical protein